MDHNFYLVKLLPLRPDFAFTLTDNERKLMNDHATYWRQKMAGGKVIVFGPVMDSEGPYGLGIIKAVDDKEVKEFINSDPASTLFTVKFDIIKAVIPESLKTQDN